MRDRRGRSPSPRPIGEALAIFTGEVAPVTPLARAQSAWASAVGSHIAAVTEVVSESEGVLTIECSSSVWSQELDLMEPRLRASLAEKIQGEPPQKLRFSTAS